MGFSNLRADRGQLSPPITAMIYEGRVARTHVPGDPLVYKSGPEHRDSTELARIVDQLPNLKIYLGHPSIYPAAKSGQKEVGTVESGRLDEDTAVARMAITDQEALDAINAGTHELSLGYQCVLDGDKFQRNITLDHLAIVPVARCGSTCSMRVDMEEIVMETNTMTIKVNVELTDEAKKTLAALDAAMKSCPYGITGCDCGANTDAVLHAKERNALGSGEFAVPESRKLPIHDEAHVRAAMSRFSQTDFGSSAEKRTAYNKIIAKAHSFGIDTKGFEAAHKSDNKDTPPQNNGGVGTSDAIGTSGHQDCTCKSRAMSHTSGETTMADTELQGKLDAALAEIASLKDKVTALEVAETNARKDADAAKAKVDAAEALAAEAKTAADAQVAQAKADASQALSAEMNARVAARVSLVTEASKFLGDSKLDGMSDREIKCAVIKHVDGDEVATDKPDAFVDGVYSGSVKRGSAAVNSRDAVRVTINDLRKDGTPLKGTDLEAAAKQNMNRESTQAWTK